MEELKGNHQCEEGCNDLASIYCDCVGRKVFLCDACFPVHRKKSPRLAHVTLGVEVTTPSLIYQQRCAEFVKRREELLGFVGKLEECSAELGRAVDEVMTTLQTYRETQITQLERWKAELTSLLNHSIHEVEASLNQENPVLQCTYSHFLRGVQTDCPLYFDFKADTALIKGCMHNFLSCVWEKQKFIKRPSLNPHILPTSTVQPQVSNSPVMPLSPNLCFMCECPISSYAWLSSLPADLTHLKEKGKDLCSLKCARHVHIKTQTSSKHLKCSGCSEVLEVATIAGPTVTSMHCGHPFHDKACLERCLWRRLQCPECKVVCEETEKTAIFGPAALADLEASRCSLCGLGRATKTHGLCNHQLCDKCDYGILPILSGSGCRECNASSTS